MIDFRNIEGIYFVGIGGIGMSALALYFARGGYRIAGYDRSKSMITDKLTDIGCDISYKDEPDSISAMFKNADKKKNVLVVYTPAIPPENRVLSYFRGNGYSILKRSEVLGEISARTDTIAIAGTHGKTTVSTMTAHLLKQSHVDCSAFLGGISKNYDSNLIVGDGPYTVIEADEFDRSFLRLSPLIALITAADADHLEIYGDLKTMIAGYNEFCRRIRKGGILIINSRIKDIIICPEGITCLTYGDHPDSDYRYSDIVRSSDYYSFNLKTPEGIIKELHFPFPGIINIENITAAMAIALECGVSEDEIRKAMVIFRGVRRRFDIRVNLPRLVYVDDYAHHPEEIRACIISLREYFRGRSITGIFQPHLFSRTLEHAGGFAEILDQLDEVVLLPVYPAREKPVPGVTSELILNKMKNKNKRLMELEDVTAWLDVKKLDVLVTVGAGNIDALVEPIERKLKGEGGE
jgi:UDP-N-acetylmuramate--alanine ligase